MGVISGAQQATMDMASQRAMNADLRDAMRQKAAQVNAPAEADRAALNQGQSRAQRVADQKVVGDEITTAVSKGQAVSVGSSILAESRTQLAERQSSRVSDPARVTGPAAADALSRARQATVEAGTGARPERAVQEQLRSEVKNAPDITAGGRAGYAPGMRVDAFA